MRRFIRDRAGVSALEFALVAPVLIFTILGGLDLGYNEYIRSVLEGEMNKASRDRALEGNTSPAARAALEARVRSTVQELSHAATVTFARKSYRNYSGLVRPEDFNDANGNGACDASEVYQDANNNGVWDRVQGNDDSGGGAKDVVVYTATVNYPRLMGGTYFPWGSTGVISAKTLLRNQPFDRQSSVVQRGCT